MTTDDLTCHQLMERVRQAEINLAVLKTSLDERFAASAQALQRAETELARRLEHLNNEQGRIARRDELFMQKESWEPRIISLERSVNKAIGAAVVVSIVVGLIFRLWR